MKNLLRKHRKSNQYNQYKKNKFQKYVIIIFAFIMTTFAWLAYAKILNTHLNMHVAAWDMEYYIGDEKKENPIGIEFPTLYPQMPEQTVTVDILNNGEALVDLSYDIQAISIAGTSYEIVKQGKQPATTNYINIEEPTSEIEEATGKVIFKGKIINDTNKFPFTLEIEHYAQVESKGRAYLKVTAKWPGDNDELDTQWGYVVGKYFNDNPNAKSAMSITLSVNSYQANEEIRGNGNNVTTGGTYLPDGFTQVEGTTLENGLTIQDSKGNQYVWVEVPKTSEVYPTAGLNITTFNADEYTTIETDLHTYTKDYRNGTSYKDEYYSDATTGLTSAQYTELKQKMLKSVYKNGGFYVGKYETGIEDMPKTDGSESTAPTEIPVIKQNAYPYNYVTCSQAQTLASKMESGNYTSSLMFGVQWDLVLKYLETKGTVQADLKTNSANWGNYNNNLWNITNANSKYALNGSGWTKGAYGKKDSSKRVLLSTGASETFSKQGIYDIAGNVWEWTLEHATSDSSRPCATRGGCCNDNGYDYPAGYRGDGDMTNFINNVGFRLSLY